MIMIRVVIIVSRFPFLTGAREGGKREQRRSTSNVARVRNERRLTLKLLSLTNFS